MKKTTTGIIIAIFVVINMVPIALQTQSSKAFFDPTFNDRSEPKAPMAVSGESVYVTWWTNKTGNWEVLFRASNDGGQTFGEKINLSNTTDADSENAEIIAQGDNVFVSWWENSLQNTTSESVLRISNDNGATFGPILHLGSNNTISTSRDE
ncbi:MAG: hypothetical protein M3162_00395 [Thermoproteota archaeon]|nr:hypothetical protein [Thermoproteota archaeon]